MLFEDGIRAAAAAAAVKAAPIVLALKLSWMVVAMMLGVVRRGLGGDVGDIFEQECGAKCDGYEVDSATDSAVDTDDLIEVVLLY